MTVDADYENLYKVPLLGDIPLLGNLFKVRQKNKQRIERLFLITPRLVPLGSRVGPIVTSSTTVRPGPIAPNTGVGTLTPMAATATTTGSSKR
jgi:type III secretion protein C